MKNSLIFQNVYFHNQCWEIVAHVMLMRWVVCSAAQLIRQHDFFSLDLTVEIFECKYLRVVAAWWVSVRQSSLMKSRKSLRKLSSVSIIVSSLDSKTLLRIF